MTDTTGSTHSDDDLWRIIAFVRQLPDLTASQKKVLQEASQQGHRHGGLGGEDKQHDHSEAGDGHSQHHHGCRASRSGSQLVRLSFMRCSYT